MVQAVKQLWAMGLSPVLLGCDGQRPADPDGESRPAGYRLGIRCGRQPLGLCLTVLAFAAEAADIFAQWRQLAEAAIYPSLLVASNGCGYHVYLFTGPEYVGCTLAGRYEARNGRARLVPSITLLGRGQQVVAAGGSQIGSYHILDGKCYDDIPLVTIAEYEALLALCRRFDRRTPTMSCAFAAGSYPAYVVG